MVVIVETCQLVVILLRLGVGSEFIISHMYMYCTCMQALIYMTCTLTCTCTQLLYYIYNYMYVVSPLVILGLQHTIKSSCSIRVVIVMHNISMCYYMYMYVPSQLCFSLNWQSQYLTRLA